MANKYDLYINAYANALLDNKEKLKKLTEEQKELIKKLVLYGVKAVITKPEKKTKTRDEAENYFKFISGVKSLMSFLTPKEFINVFPINKEYDGHKYGMKDYFYTKKYLKELDQNEPIGEKILEFLWKYHNWEIGEFVVNSMTCISDLQRLNGQPSLAEKFADEMGLKTYGMYTDNAGNKFLLDGETGKTHKVLEKKHLHVVR